MTPVGFLEKRKINTHTHTQSSLGAWFQGTAPTRRHRELGLLVPFPSGLETSLNLVRNPGLEVMVETDISPPLPLFLP